MRRAHRVVALTVALAVVLGLGACGGDKPNRTAGPTTRLTTTASTGAAPCSPPTTIARRATTTAVPAPGQWPPPGYDRSALVPADVVAATATAVTVRWPAPSGTTCTATLAVSHAWVLDANGYRRIPARDLPAFVASRQRDLGVTHQGVPFLVEVSRDGRSATQLGEVPPG